MLSASRVLIIDDNPADRQLVLALVQRELPEVQLQSVANEEAFEAALQEGGFSCVLLDYFLHWGNGLEAAARLRNRFPRVPIIFFCGEVSDAIRTRIFEAAPDDFVAKSPAGFLLLAGTLRRQLEKAQHHPGQPQGRLDSLLERSRLGYFRATAEGRLLEISPALADLLSLPREAEETQLPFRLYFLSESPQALAKRLEQEPPLHRSEFSVTGPEGQQIWLGVTESVAAERPDQPWIEGLVVDLTSARQSRQDLERSNRKLQEFASMASHQLQEPLRMVARYTGLLASQYADRLDTDARECLHFAHDGAERMQRLVDDLLSYSRAGKAEMKIEACDTTLLVQQALADLRLLIEERKAVVTWNGLPLIRADCNLMGQVFRNLIGNAVKHYSGQEVPMLRIWCERRAEENWFFFRDNGPGLAPEQREKIFEPFKRLDPRAPGSGLGLAICQRILERHGGRIWVESDPGRGATFIVALSVSPVS